MCKSNVFFFLPPPYPETCRPGYLSAFRELRTSNNACFTSIDDQLDADDFERRVTELHKLHRGQTPAEARSEKKIQSTSDICTFHLGNFWGGTWQFLIVVVRRPVRFDWQVVSIERTVVLTGLHQI